MFRLTRLSRPASQLRFSSSFSRPGPPKLPAAQQAEFERLQKDAAVSQAFQPDAAPTTKQVDEAALEGALYKGAKPEFEGDKNPKTGEVGGPKNEPLRWGGDKDWSYNGKVTDF